MLHGASLRVVLFPLLARRRCVLEPWGQKALSAGQNAAQQPWLFMRRPRLPLCMLVLHHAACCGACCRLLLYVLPPFMPLLHADAVARCSLQPG